MPEDKILDLLLQLQKNIQEQLKRINEALEDVETKKEEVEEKVEKEDRKNEDNVPEEKKEVDEDDDGEDEDDEEDEDDDSESDVEMEKDDKPHNSPSIKSLGDEKLASEYEQFMKMVATDSPSKSTSSSSKHSSKVTSSAVSPSNYDDFNLEIDISKAKDCKFVNQLPVAQSPKPKVKIEANRKKESLEIPAEAESVMEPIKASDECNQESTEKETHEDVEEAPEENQDSDSRSIPSDWENVTIKVEQLSDENVEVKTSKKKKKQPSYSTGSESSSSSSSSNSNVKSKKRRKKKKVAKSSSDSDSSDSSSSDSSSSDEARKKKRKRSRKKKRVKKASRKARKKRSRKRADSSSSDSYNTRKKKKRLKRKKLKKKAVEENKEDVRKRKRKSSTRSISRDKKVKRTHIEKVSAEGKKKRKKRLEKVKRVKLSNDLQKQILAKALSPDSVLLKECDMGKEQNLIQEQAQARRQQKKKKRQESEDRLSEWEKESILMTKQIEGIMDQSMSLDESPEREDIAKDEIGERKINEKEEKSDIPEAEGEKVEEILEEENFKGGAISLTVELKEKEEMEKKENEKRVSEEFLADWERESQRIAKVLTEETPDFDSLNVPSLTQLEEEVRKRDIFDEWEVDSLDAIRESTAKMRCSKKKEKVLYDEKTDTYITLQKESSKESKKKQERLSAIRIWEDEQEEGEREEMLLIKQKTKLKKEVWNTDEEFLKMRADKTLEINTDDLLQTNLSEEMIKKEKSKSSEKSEDVESPKKKELEEKRRKKSRWDVGNQPEDSDDIQMTPVMWEEESIDWQKSSGTETALLKLAKVKEQICSPILETLPGEIKLEVFNIPEVSSLDLIDVASADIFQRKLQQMRLPENTWLSKDHKSPIVSIEESELAGSKFEVEGGVKLKSIVELQEQVPKNVDLYSPSSPALSQRSEEVSSDDIETKEPEQRKTKEKSLILNIDSSVCNIPLPSEKTPVASLVKEETVRSIDSWREKKSCDDLNKYNDLQLDSLNSEVESLKETQVEIPIVTECSKLSEKKPLNHADNAISLEIPQMSESPSKIALKLIPKQLLIRRPNEQGKTKGLIQSNLNDVFENPSDYDDDASSRADSKSEFGDRTPVNKFESPKGDKVEIDKRENSDKSDRRSDSRDRLSSKRDKDSGSIRSKSPLRDFRRRSPPRRDRDKREGDDRSKNRGIGYYNEKNKEKERSEKDSRNSKSIYNDNKRRASPLIGRGKPKRGGSPWEDERSRSRSFSKSPRRGDGSRERNKKLDDDRFSRSNKGDDRRDRTTRSPVKGYKDNRKRPLPRESPPRSDRDRGKRRCADSVERERDRDAKHYDPMEMLRDRSLDSERLRNNRFRNDEEPQKPYWRFEDDSGRRDDKEYIDSYVNSQNPALDYEDRSYIRNRSLDRDVEDPLRSSSKAKNTNRSRPRSNDRRDRTWNKNRSSPVQERSGPPLRRRDKLPPRRSSSRRRSPGRFTRYGSRSRSRSWSKTRSRTRSRSRSRSMSRSSTTSRSPSISRSRARLNSPNLASRHLERVRSLSTERGRNVRVERLKEDEDRSMSAESSISCPDRGRRMETIIQLTGGADAATDPAFMESETIANESVDNLNSCHFRYASETETGNEYSYYPRNNLTYPPRIDEPPTSPKRLSLDERLELELGIKKPTPSGEYLPANFNSIPGVYPPIPSVQQHRAFHQPSTVLQVGNVLQVVPGDYSGIPVPGVRSEASSVPLSKVVRVGNVLQVVPTTSIDWSGNPQPAIDRKTGARYPVGIHPAPANIPISVPMSLPIPVPLPVPVPVSVNPSSSGSTISPIPLSLSIPMPLSLPLPVTTAVTSVKKIPTPSKEVPAIPVYDYEAILEVRRREKEERKRVREERKREKERRKLERATRRAERIQGRRLLTCRPDIDQKQLDRLKRRNLGQVLPESELAVSVEEEKVDEKEDIKENVENTLSPVVKTENITGEGEEEEEEEEEEPEAEVEVEDDEDEDVDEEDEEEEEDEDKKSSPSVQLDEIPTAAEVEESVQIEVDVDVREWPSLPPPPLKGILVSPGFGVVLNGDAKDLFEQEDDMEEQEELEQEDEGSIDTVREENKDNGVDEKAKLQAKRRQTRAQRLQKVKKNVQFADGIRPGEGTSPSGGEGEMPSPPPLTTSSISKESVLELIRRSRSRKSRRKQKRVKSSKTKKKVKVKIIKLKKPRITPLTALMLEDSDEADDRSPPPPPPGSPPPTHMWPSYLAAYNAALKTVTSNPLPPPAIPAQSRPPPTPLPLLVPPPPLNYTIQPCSKA